jgi:TPR repeat protein
MYVDAQTLPALFTLLSQLNIQKTSLDASLNEPLDQLNQIARKIGLELFALESFDKAELCLTVAAAQGNVEAQYAMATCVTRRDGGFRVPSEETRKWLRLAAAQHHVPALLRLGDAESLEKASELLTPAATAGATEAMRLLFTLTNDVKWLDMAVARNDHTAQFQLADAYRKAPQRVPNAVERNALIEELLQKAADGGDRSALADRVFSRNSTASVLEKQQRLIQFARLGQLDALLEYGYALAAMPRHGEGMSNVVQRHPTAPRTYALEKDLAKAYAVRTFALPKLPEYPVAETLKNDLDAIWHQMTPQQISAANTLHTEMQASIPTVFKSLGPLNLVGRPY